MKPYGYKKLRKPPGDGCPLCLKGLSVRSKSSKSANRRKAKEAAKKEVEDAIRDTDISSKERTQ